MRNDYYQWLISLIRGGGYDARYYSNLLFDLDNIEFTWSIHLDENRAGDGLCLRSEYGCNREGPCSVLEMLIGLSHRVEQEYIEDGEAGEFFWNMIKSLGLIRNDDYHYNQNDTYSAIDKLLSRSYNSNGSNGGLFVLQNPRDDLRNIQIWQQAMWYLTEKMYETDRGWLDN